ncbi:MAG: hypothetical protein J5669_00945 [Bacteroidales bacterium]|nr:hypothetical protein [Bacteroidales bacterium]
MSTLLIGDHPVLQDFPGKSIHSTWPDSLEPGISRCVVAFREQKGDLLLQDSETFDRLRSLIRPSGHVVYQVLIHSPLSARLYAQADSLYAEFHPFTKEGAWALKLLGPDGLVQLDGDGIHYEDGRSVHLVILGATPAAEALALQAAKICHFPNYIRDPRLRTRITFIDPEAWQWSRQMISRHRELFQLSRYSFVDLHTGEVNNHFPEGEDFVDLEWEFVQASPWAQPVEERLRLWCHSPQMLTTVAFAFGENEMNQKALGTYEACLGSSSRSIVVPFDMVRGFADTGMTLRNMGMAVNAIYENMVEYGKAPLSLDMDDAARRWEKLSARSKQASMDSAQALGVKMRSFGLKEEDGNINYLSEVEHNRWTVATLLSGMRPASLAEKSAIEQDIRLKKSYLEKGVHYDLRPFAELRTDEHGLDTKLYDQVLSQCIPMIFDAASR